MGQIKNIKLHIVTDIKLTMACLHRNTKKIIGGVFTCAGRTTTRNLSRRLTINTTSSTQNVTNKLFKSCNSVSFIAARQQQCRHMHSEGDEDLAKFLHKEIAMEV